MKKLYLVLLGMVSFVLMAFISNLLLGHLGMENPWRLVIAYLTGFAGTVLVIKQMIKDKN